MNFEGIDGKQFLNAILLAQMKKDGDVVSEKLLKIFNKYKLSFLDGVAMLIEIVAAIENAEGGETDV